MWWKTVTKTDDAVAPAVLRWTLALVMFPHGAQKVLGWFGGYGWSGTMGYFTDVLGVPAVLASLVFLAELLGPIGLAVGLATRVAAGGIAAVMAGAIAISHWPHGFFMNWSGQQAGEGFEFHLLALGIAVALVVAGGGRGSLDRKLSG